MVILLAFWLGAFSPSAGANEKILVDHHPININYGSPSWNTDSRKIDSAFMVVKDKSTGKIVQIQLEETEPDSSNFTGQFSVSLGGQPLQPEVYIPPKHLRSEKDYRKVHQLIQSKQLPRKPLIIKKDPSGRALIDVYDTKEQAEAALKAYQEKQRLEAEAKKQKLLKQVPDKDAVAAAQDAAHKAALAKLAIEAAEREAERIRLEQIERQKAEERARQAKLASERERAARRRKAVAAADAAMAFYTQGEFEKAEAKFREAVELDPENKTFYFRYGVTLYRRNKFNEALVILKLATVEPKLETERQYFIGLTHYRLNELDNARAALAKAAESSDPIMGPSAAFYLGVVQYSQSDFEAAKKSFERVIDTSRDARMDQQAEEYLDRIAQALMFKKLQEKRWTANGVLGLSYDSNVLLTPDTVSSTATKEADARLITVGDLTYRAVYNQHHEFSLKGTASLTNSSKSEVAHADPFLYNFNAPYSYKTVVWGKGYVFTVKPAYELLFMDANKEGTKSRTLASQLVSFDNLFVMRNNWFAIYSLEVRRDDFELGDSVGDNNYDAMKYTLKTTQSFYMDKARKEALVANLGYTMNNASGKNKKFNRIDIGATYIRPMKWGYSWNFGLSAYDLNYADSDDSRKDFNITITTGVDKPIREWVSWGVTASYTKNDSTEEASYEYSKYTIMTTATFTTNF